MWTFALSPDARKISFGACNEELLQFVGQGQEAEEQHEGRNQDRHFSLRVRPHIFHGRKVLVATSATRKDRKHHHGTQEAQEDHKLTVEQPPCEGVPLEVDGGAHDGRLEDIKPVQSLGGDGDQM